MSTEGSPVSSENVRVAFKTSCKFNATFFVSESDRESVEAFLWYLCGNYPRSPKQGKNLHEFIIGPRPEGVPEEYVIDHRDRNTLNCMRPNLRYVSASFNSWNRASPANCTSKYKGVCWSKSNTKWVVRFAGGYVGYFEDEREAGKAAAKAAIREYGDWAATSDLLCGPGLFSEEEISAIRMEIDTEVTIIKAPRELPTGVRFDAKLNKYAAKYRRQHLGYFTCPIEAKNAYEAAVKAAYDADWDEHVRRGIQRDADGDAVIALSGKAGEGLFSKVPERFYFRLTFKHKWNKSGNYAVGTWNKKLTKLHAVVWGLLHPGYKPVKGMSIDHRDPTQTLNNLECNLRLVSTSDQMRNQTKRAGTTSQYKGVYYAKKDKLWLANVHVNGKPNIEYHKTELDAARAVNRMRLALLGSDAVLLIINEDEAV